MMMIVRGVENSFVFVVIAVVACQSSNGRNLASAANLMKI